MEPPDLDAPPPDPLPGPPPAAEYPLGEALRSGVPASAAEYARRVGRLHLIPDPDSDGDGPNGDGSPVVFLLDFWPPRPLGTWTAKRHRGRRTFTGYAGRHRPRGGGVPGLSAAGIRRALDGLDRQEARWKGPGPDRCPCCGRWKP